MEDPRKVQVPEFRSPVMSRREYNNLSGPEFEDLCATVLEKNRLWARGAMKNPNTYWIVVLDSGKVIERGDSNLVPSFFQVREMTNGKRGYLLYRPGEKYCDTELFLPTTEDDIVGERLGRSVRDIQSYLNPVEGISHVHVQSGHLPRLQEGFALGQVVYESPLLKGSKETRHSEGSSSARISIKGFPKIVRVASQSLAEVNARGIKTLDQRQPDKWVRMERLHRFDDAIVDMFDTYNFKKDATWPSLLLYRKRAN